MVHNGWHSLVLVDAVAGTAYREVLDARGASWVQIVPGDEFFLVLEGRFTINLRDRDPVVLGPGDTYVVPRGVEHRPVAKELVSIVLFEPATVRNTGAAVDERTIEPEDLERI